MFNTIKKINMERIFYSLSNSYKGRSEEELEQLCVSLENLDEFKNLFFLIEGNHDYFYHSSNEEEIKNQMRKIFTGLEISDLWFYNFGEELVEYCDSDEVIELHDRLGKIEISMLNLYESLSDEFLKENEYVDRLVNAPNFNQELALIKKECLTYLFDMAITEARKELEKYEF